MEKSFRYFLELGLLLSLSLPSFGQSLAASGTEHRPHVTVWVLERVHMPPDRLAEAEHVATQILGQAGVQAVWLDCTITIPNGQGQPACDRPLESTALILTFVEEIQLLSPKKAVTTLGFVPVSDGGGQSDRAYISNRRALDAARECEASLGTILGLAVAHEIGHLLMGSGKHSRSGLMRDSWDAKDLVRAAQGDLRFTDDQVTQVRAGALARMAKQTQSQAASPR